MSERRWSAVPCKCVDGCSSYVVEGLHHADGRMSREDSNLIAAAPDLLEALERVLASPGGTLDRTSASKARAAIAKAQGKGK